MSTLEKAVTQEHITEDTVDFQFCSDWLKDEIKLLFHQITKLKTALRDIDRMAHPHDKIRAIAQHALKEST